MISARPALPALFRLLPVLVFAVALAGPVETATASETQSVRRSSEGGSPNITAVAGSSWETSPPRLTLGDNASFRLLAEIALRYDDNIFAAADNEVSDTIISVTPGLEFRFGNNSRVRGSLLYREAFTRYLDETAPNANLGSGQADISFESGRLALSGGVSMRQLYQNTQDVAGLGQDILARSDVRNIHVSAESPLTTKTAFSVGAHVNRLQYKTEGLIGTQDLTLPVKVYFDLTPKVSLTTGYTYRRVKPQGGGDQSRDLDYNVGARGNFTPKLSGQFSFGYRTRRVADNAAENLWGFDGSFAYEMTPLVNSTFLISRDFGTGVQGESIKNSSFSFELTAAPALQWRVSTGLAYRHVEYGPVVFGPTTPLPTAGRKDNYWEANVQTTFFPGRSFNTSLGYTLSTNRSTRQEVRYGINALTLMLGWQY